MAEDAQKVCTQMSDETYFNVHRLLSVKARRLNSSVDEGVGGKPARPSLVCSSGGNQNVFFGDL